MDNSEACEKAYYLDTAVEWLKLYFLAEYKNFQIVIDKRKSSRLGVRYYIYRYGRDTGDFYYQFSRIADFYRRMGTAQLKEYWLSLKDSPYYEDNSYFKQLVDSGVENAEQLREQGYVYKPATKENQARFLAVAKERGWR